MACPLCDDTGWRPMEVDGVRRVVRCDCWKRDATMRLLEQAHVPRRYQHCTLDSFTAYNERLALAVDHARRLVEQGPLAERGLLLLGPPGVGKTHVSVGVLRELVLRYGLRGLFYDTRDLLRVIRSTYDPSVHTTEPEVLRPVIDAQVLVLDDLGAEKTSEWVDETLNLIVNSRYSGRRLTLLTSNYPDTGDLAEPDSLRARIGFRMYSRLLEMCEPVHLDGLDYREPRPPNADDAESLRTEWEARKSALKKLPSRTSAQARARLRAARLQTPAEPLDVKWPGGRAGS
ncbi:MAG: DNA replication protein DnaC [Luteitalea sp.]|nr:DNA replication protein DnaC [Luteitalea sp.]